MRNILIVDDETRIVEILEDYLKLNGFSVTTASNARSAMWMLAGNASPDLIILDAKMPGMTGEDLVREMRKHGKMTPVILLTGSIHIHPAENGAKSPYENVLFKPVRLSELLDAVNAAFSGASAGEPSKGVS